MFKLAPFPDQDPGKDAEADETLSSPAKLVVMDDDEGRRESGSTMERQ